MSPVLLILASSVLPLGLIRPQWAKNMPMVRCQSMPGSRSQLSPPLSSPSIPDPVATSADLRPGLHDPGAARTYTACGSVCLNYTACTVLLHTAPALGCALRLHTSVPAGLGPKLHTALTGTKCRRGSRLAGSRHCMWCSPGVAVIGIMCSTGATLARPYMAPVPAALGSVPYAVRVPDYGGGEGGKGRREGRGGSWPRSNPRTSLMPLIQSVG